MFVVLNKIGLEDEGYGFLVDNTKSLSTINFRI